MLGSIVGTVATCAGLIVVGRYVVGVVGMALHTPPAATGDPTVARVLDDTATRRTRKVVAALVDLDADQPVRTGGIGADGGTVFEIGSVSKALTGLLLADAVDRGEVELDAPLADRLPALRDTPVGARTLRQLAEHRSGLPRLPHSPAMAARSVAFGMFGTDPYRGIGERAVVRAAGRAHLSESGEPRYSNLGAALAGAVLGAAAGTSYAALVTDRLVAPLDLTHTSADPQASRRWGWTRRGLRVAPWRLDGYCPAGGITSTTDDLAAVLVAILTGRAPGAAALADGVFWVRERLPSLGDIVWHNGQTGGYSAYLAVLPDRRRGVAVLSNVADALAVGRIAGTLLHTHVSADGHLPHEPGADR